MIMRMNNMKQQNIKRNKKIAKTTALVSLLSLALILPSTILTSCSTISQYFIPVLTSNNPFSSDGTGNEINFYSSSSPLIDPYFENGEFSDGSSLNHSNAIVPSSYIYTTAYDNSFAANATAYYGYTNYSTPEWNSSSSKWTFNSDDFNDYQYISSTNSNLTYLDNSTLTSYENLLNSIAIQSVNVVSSNLITLFNYINNYIVHIFDNCKTSADLDKKLSILFTNSESNFTHSSGTTDEENLNFYEYFMSNANLLAQGSAKYKFGPYMLNWKVVDSGLIQDSPSSTQSLFPQINLDPTDSDGNDLPTPDDTSTNYTHIPNDQSLIGYYEYNDDTETYTYIPPSDTQTSTDEVYEPYNVYSFDDDGNIDDITSIANVPVLIRLGDITSSYYDAAHNNSSISPTDWLYNDDELDNISNEINSTDAWKNVKESSGLGDDLKLTSTSFNLKVNNNSNSDTSNWTSDLSKVDPTIAKWASEGTIHPGDFIALANYSLLTIEFTYEYDNGTKTEHFKTKLPYFSGFTTVFPAYLVFTSDDVYTTINDDSNIDKIKTNVIDFSEDGSLYKSFTNIISNLTDYSKLNPTISEYSSSTDAFNNDPYFIYWWLFGNNSSSYTSSSSSKSSDFISIPS